MNVNVLNETYRVNENIIYFKMNNFCTLLFYIIPHRIDIIAGSKIQFETFDDYKENNVKL